MPQRTTMQHLAAPLRQQVVQLLRQDILDATLTPGERLRESDLCERYGVSRTVVREALRQLESESLITMLPNRGPIVTILRVKDIESLYEVRARLEGLAGEMFAKRASAADAAALLTHLHVMEIRYLHGSVDERAASKDEFYNLLLRGADNEVLTSDTAGSAHPHRHSAALRLCRPERVNISMEEVRRIVDATAVRRDPELARTTCEDHIRRAGELAVIEYQRHNRSAMVS